jgi:hypothetical protein
MGNCPVCDTVVTDLRETCGECGTPLRQSSESSSGWFRKLTVLIPGFIHLWNGYIIRGTVGLFGTFLLLVSLYSSLAPSVSSQQFVFRVLLWGLLWLVWTGVWYWDSHRISSVSPTAGRIVSVVVVLLILANGLMTSIVISLLLGGPR